MYKNLFRHLDYSNIWIRSSKIIKYETIDFNFKPKHVYILKRIQSTKYIIPNVPYKEQYECRDF
jgi:hypothetical protein